MAIPHPEAFGWFDETTNRSLGVCSSSSTSRPSIRRAIARTLDLATGSLGLPVSLRDKTTLVDESMAGVSRTQVYAATSSLLFTLYQPATPDPANSEYDVWEYGFVHTLATQFAGVWCIDLPEELGMTDNSGALALSPAEQTLYVVTGAGKLGVINSADLNSLRVSRIADLGVALGETAHPVMAAGSDHLWISMHRELLMVDPISLEVQGRRARRP